MKLTYDTDAETVVIAQTLEDYRQDLLRARRFALVEAIRIAGMPMASNPVGYQGDYQPVLAQCDAAVALLTAFCSRTNDHISRHGHPLAHEARDLVRRLSAGEIAAKDIDLRAWLTALADALDHQGSIPE